MNIRTGFVVSFFFLLSTLSQAEDLPLVHNIEPQPLVAQVVRLNEALGYLGSVLLPEDTQKIAELKEQTPSDEQVQAIQEILDPYCLAMVTINPESRVKVMRGPARAELIQSGWTSFLIKVHNEAGITPVLNVESPNAEPLFHGSSGSPTMKEENRISEGDVANRFLELDMFRRPPMQKSLSGLGLEYTVLQVYTIESGQREAHIGFNVGQGTQEIGFLNAIDILFDCKPSVEVVLRVKDHDGSPTMASFIVSDNLERITDDPVTEPFPKDYRLSKAQRREWETNNMQVKRLTGIYPLPSRRLARNSEYPDFFFHPQVYRADGEHLRLPPGTFTFTYTRGPEYIPQTRQVVIPKDVENIELEFQLKRWTHLADLGWYSGDHHVHAAGCSHYESPLEGVKPNDMFRQAMGEDLNIACVLTWGPCWYFQKSFFGTEESQQQTHTNLMRYDVEVSGFPSSHAGHVCLLRLKEDDYPGTTKIEEWPSWTLPVLKWAKEQGGAVGYAHSGWGLEPQTPTRALPNYVIPKYDGIGANEYIVSVAHNLVDFYSAVDTPYPFELNMWYHTLNCGFRTRLSGETDFPCIFDERVGMGRVYAKTDSLDFDQFVDRIVEGRSYVSDGKSHIIDFTVNGLESGTQNSELKIDGPQKVSVKARVSAYLMEEQDEEGAIISGLSPQAKPYWHIERARIEKSREVPVELVINGESVDRKIITADGEWNDIEFEAPIKKSSWVTLRILPSSHSNPVFVLVDDKPIRASAESAEWCRKGVDKCWEEKVKNIRSEEQEEARAAYDKARMIYDRIIEESQL